jgi:hypothetical protein
VGIAIKKFASIVPLFIDQAAADEELEEDGAALGSMPAVFHYQAFYTPQTGNQVYGGTVNFQHSLTDAGLQEYHLASEAWHAVVQDPLGRAIPPSAITPSISRSLPPTCLSQQVDPGETGWE